MTVYSYLYDPVTRTAYAPAGVVRGSSEHISAFWHDGSVDLKTLRERVAGAKAAGCGLLQLDSESLPMDQRGGKDFAPIAPAKINESTTVLATLLTECRRLDMPATVYGRPAHRRYKSVSEWQAAADRLGYTTSATGTRRYPSRGMIDLETHISFDAYFEKPEWSNDYESRLAEDAAEATRVAAGRPVIVVICPRTNDLTQDVPVGEVQFKAVYAARQRGLSVAVWDNGTITPHQRETLDMVRDASAAA